VTDILYFVSQSTSTMLLTLVFFFTWFASLPLCGKVWLMQAVLMTPPGCLYPWLQFSNLHHQLNTPVVSASVVTEEEFFNLLPKATKETVILRDCPVLDDSIYRRRSHEDDYGACCHRRSCRVNRHCFLIQVSVVRWGRASWIRGHHPEYAHNTWQQKRD
jgi:hypothetical protein